LDDSLRRSWGQLNDWYGIRLDGIDNISQENDDDRVFLGLTASHRNGHVRAAAVRALGLETSSLVIPFCLLRLSDWVSVMSSVYSW
jgi:hypothetical protein